MTQKPIKAVLDSSDDSVKTQKPILIQLDDIPTPEVGDAGKVLGVDDEGKFALTDYLVEITYSELKALRDGGNLAPGTVYRITDYVTKINGKYDLTLVGAQGYLHYAKSAEHPFDLCVIAMSKSELDEHAVATLHAGDTYFKDSDLGSWDIKYTIDNDPDKYLWADPTNGKGVIFFMRDEYGNEAGYDFKNAQFLAYALAMADLSENPDSLCYDAINQVNRYGSLYGIFSALTAYMQTGTYASPYANSGHDFAVGANILGVIQFPEVDATYLSTFQADWYYTFDLFFDNSHTDASLSSIINESKLVMHNKIAATPDAVFMQLKLSPTPFGLNGSIFEFNFNQSSVRCEGNELGWGSVANIFGGGECFLNKCSDLFYGNIFGFDCCGNSFLNFCYSNTFEDFCTYNSFGNNCQHNSFGNSCNRNTFGNGCDYNSFGSACSDNSFGYGCVSNVFGDYCNDNIFDSTCTYNSFGNNCQHNSFGKGCYNNTFGNGCDYNSFGSACSDNSFGYGCYNNTFGNNCSSNVFGTLNGSGNAERNKFGENCKYIHLAAGTAGNENSVRNYEIKNQVQGTPITPYEPTVTEGNLFVTCIGYNSQGSIVSWVPAD